MVLPDSSRISRVLLYSGAASLLVLVFAYGEFSLLGQVFHSCSTEADFLYFRGPSTPDRSGLGSGPFARRYSGCDVLFSFPPGP